ncbi:MAG: hypothetical protein KA158_03015 [Leucobacter sp.]|nr:hypothetical protein [Leucobacter sp.]
MITFVVAEVRVDPFEDDAGVWAPFERVLCDPVDRLEPPRDEAFLAM